MYLLSFFHRGPRLLTRNGDNTNATPFAVNGDLVAPLVSNLSISLFSRASKSSKKSRDHSICCFLLRDPLLSLRRFNYSLLPLRPSLPRATSLHTAPSQHRSHRRRTRHVFTRSFIWLPLRPNWPVPTIIRCGNHVCDGISSCCIYVQERGFSGDGLDISERMAVMGYGGCVCDHWDGDDVLIY